MPFEPTARGRLICAAMAVTGACICSSALLLTLAYILGIVPTLILTRVVRAHYQFLLAIVAPVAAMSVLVWPLMMGAPPGELAGSNPSGALSFAFLTVFRLMFVGGVFQSTLLSLDSSRLTTTLWRWGIRGEWLVVVLAAIVLGPEMKRRADRVMTAAAARGMLRSRQVWHRMRIAVATVVPLTAWGLRSAVDRAETWHQRSLVERIELVAVAPESGNVLFDSILAATCAFWMTIAVLSRWGSQWL
jgi:hypothetical protein